jgi:hypothetical protein
VGFGLAVGYAVFVVSPECDSVWNFDMGFRLIVAYLQFLLDWLLAAVPCNVLPLLLWCVMVVLVDGRLAASRRIVIESHFLGGGECFQRCN